MGSYFIIAAAAVHPCLTKICLYGNTQAFGSPNGCRYELATLQIPTAAAKKVHCSVPLWSVHVAPISQNATSCLRPWPCSNTGSTWNAGLPKTASCLIKMSWPAPSDDEVDHYQIPNTCWYQRGEGQVTFSSTIGMKQVEVAVPLFH